MDIAGRPEHYLEGRQKESKEDEHTTEASDDEFLLDLLERHHEQTRGANDDEFLRDLFEGYRQPTTRRQMLGDAQPPYGE